MTDFSTYQPPGVYFEDEPTTLTSVVGIAPTVVALVGPAVGYREATQAVTLESTDPVQLRDLGIDPSNGFEVEDANGVLIDPAQYALAVGGGEDGSATTTEDNTLTIARTATSTIPDGALVYVNYRYTDANYFAPQRYTDFDDVKDAFGQPFDPVTGAILSPLSLAAKVAFDNRARQIVLVATAGSSTATTPAELSAAYSKLLAVQDVNIVVPLPVGVTGTVAAPGDTTTIGNDLRVHVENASADRLFRIGILGFDRSVTVEPISSAATIASKRVALAWPNSLDYFNGFTNQVIQVSGYYLAAAYAGLIASQAVQEPITKKNIRGFNGITSSLFATMTQNLKNNYSSKGVAVTEVGPDSALMVRHGVTTDPTNVHTREISLVRSRDALVSLIDLTLTRSGLIGSAIDAETLLRVKGVMQGVLEQAVGAGVIVSYIDLKVRQRSTDPTVIEVKFQFIPAYPLNYIVVAFDVNVQTGQVDLDSLLSAA